MTGIILFFAGIVWIVIAGCGGLLAGYLISKKWWRVLFGIAVFVILLPLPLVDELVGKGQFEELCKEHSTIHVDREKAAGKTVYLTDLPRIEIKGPWVRVLMRQWRFVDVETGKIVISYETLQAESGRFIRALGLSEGSVPLTFNQQCASGNIPKAANELIRDLEIKWIDRENKVRRSTAQ
jgi:MFS family permease